METAIISLGLDVGENSEDKGEVGMRCTALLSLDLNMRHEDDNREGGGRHSRWTQTLRHTRDQEAEHGWFSLLGGTIPSNGHWRYINCVRLIRELLSIFSQRRGGSRAKD